METLKHEIRLLLNGLLLVFLAVLLSGCGSSSSSGDPGPPGGDPPAPPPDPVVQALVQGFAISPEGHPLTFENMPEFIAQATELPAPAVTWNGSWRVDDPDGAPTGEIPEAAVFVQLAAAQEGFTPIALKDSDGQALPAAERWWTLGERVEVVDGVVVLTEG